MFMGYQRKSTETPKRTKKKSESRLICFAKVNESILDGLERGNVVLIRITLSSSFAFESTETQESGIQMRS
ncbi:g-patch domain [Moniliophthora roreri]|nr:g-patch domain [Moniliophthora roreri]